MCDRPRADRTAGDREQFRDQHADSLRGRRENRHDHHTSRPYPIGGVGCLLRTKYRSRETGPGEKGVRFTIYTNIFLGLMTFAAVYLFGDEMMRIFTKDADVITIGKEYLLVIGGFFVVHGALKRVQRGHSGGAGDTLFPMTTSLICLWLIRIPLAYYLSSWLGTQRNLVGDRDQHRNRIVGNLRLLQDGDLETEDVSLRKRQSNK